MLVKKESEKSDSVACFDSVNFEIYVKKFSVT